MEIAYDGGRFRGVAENSGVTTVVGAMRPVLERAVGHELEFSIAGRTDAGVHARAQVLSFDVVERKADPVELSRAVNRNLVPAIVAQSCSVVPDTFDARFSATFRHYQYTVVNRPVPDPFLAATTWWMGSPLDLDAMNRTCEPIIGGHDFSSFCRRPKTDVDVSLIRRVSFAQWQDLGDGLLRFDIRANAFCQQMSEVLASTFAAVRPSPPCAAV
jgi:tRNA pseudouridine38-40 synthase